MAVTEQPQKQGLNVRMKGRRMANGNGTQLMDVQKVVEEQTARGASTGRQTGGPTKV